MLPVFGPILALSIQAPVNIATCEITGPTVVQTGADAGTDTIGAYTMRVRFQNIDKRLLKRVVFSLDDGTNIVDAGTFSPGVNIDHTFVLEPTDAVSCHAVSATLADGQQWTLDRAVSAW